MVLHILNQQLLTKLSFLRNYWLTQMYLVFIIAFEILWWSSRYAFLIFHESCLVVFLALRCINWFWWIRYIRINIIFIQKENLIFVQEKVTNVVFAIFPLTNWFAWARSWWNNTLLLTLICFHYSHFWATPINGNLWLSISWWMRVLQT